MAYCENCGKTGLDPRSMFADPNRKLFMGPCCAPPMTGEGAVATVEVLPAEDQNDFGLEISNTFGVLAYGQFGGLQFKYRRPIETMPDWFQKGHLPPAFKPRPVLIMRS